MNNIHWVLCLFTSRLHLTRAFIIKRQTVPSSLLIEALLITYNVNILNMCLTMVLGQNFIASGSSAQKAHPPAG